MLYLRAQLAASQQEAAALRSEVQQLCGEIEGLQSERLRLHEAIASVESDSKAMHGIFRRHMEVRGDRDSKKRRQRQEKTDCSL